MQAAVDRMMQADGLMVNFEPDQEQEVRCRLIGHLQNRTGSQPALVIEGLKFLRNHPSNHRLGASSPR